MLKKIEQAKQFLEHQRTNFRCPYCHEDIFDIEHYSMLCQNGHRFDLSKRGTIHLMKQVSSNEYAKELFEHRYQLARAGFFAPLLEAISSWMTEESEGLTVDIGCGEGTHLDWLKKRLNLSNCVGLDIAREGIRMASAYHDASILWCLADLANLPFADESCGYLLNVLTPSHYKEFNRVLKSKGKLIKVVPGIHYLKELRQLLYHSNSDKQFYSNQDTINRFFKEFPNGYQQRIGYTFSLTEDLFEHLVQMTPLFWGSSEEDRYYTKTHPLTEISVDFVLLVGEKD